MGTTRIYFIAAVFLFVLNGACLVKGNSTDIVTTLIATTTSYSTSNDSSTSGMNSSYSTSNDSSTSGMNSSYSTSDGSSTSGMYSSYSTSNDSSTSGMNNGYSTSVDSSTSGMTSGNTEAPVPADRSSASNNPDCGITCLVCQGDNSSNCNHASPNSSMEDISEQSGCISCRIYKADTGKGTTITQIVRECNQTSCPAYLKDEYDFGCLGNTTDRICEWCCKGNNCNNFNRNSANALLAAVVLGGWTITKVVYVVVSTIAVAMSMSIMV